MPVPGEISGFPPSSQLLTSGIYDPVILGPEARYLLWNQWMLLRSETGFVSSIWIIQISDSSSFDNTLLDIMIIDEFYLIVPSPFNACEFMSRLRRSPSFIVWRNFQKLCILIDACSMIPEFLFLNSYSWIPVSSNLLDQRVFLQLGTAVVLAQDKPWLLTGKVSREEKRVRIHFIPV